MYNREREARLQASLWGHDDERFDDVDIIGREEDSLIPRGTSDAGLSVRTRLVKKIQKIIGACYPWVHASSEGVCILQLYVCVCVCCCVFLLAENVM